MKQLKALTEGAWARLSTSAAWMVGRDNADTLPPGDVRPVALVISAQTGEDLPYLEREVDVVAETLVKSREFNVYRAKNITWRGLRDILKRPGFQRRFGLLHFAGHADGKGIVLENGDVDGQRVDWKTLVAFLRDQGMGFVFLNSCLTRDIADDIEGVIPDLALIVTTDEIDDDIAEQLAVDLYREALTTQPVPLESAYTRTTRAIETDLGTPTRARDPMRRGRVGASGERDPGAVLTDDLVDWPWRLLDPLPLANLADRAYLRTQPPETEPANDRFVVYYSVIIYLIGLTSLAIAYFGVTSPAFRGAFSYAVELEKLGTIVPTAQNDGGSPHVGFFIEAFRQLMLVAFLAFAMWWCPRRALGAPAFWPLKRSWFLHPPNFITIIVAAIVLAGVTEYHAHSAPDTLAKSDAMWMAIRKDDATLTYVWTQAWSSGPSSAAEINSALAEMTPGDELWNWLYRYPYLVYYPYSLVNFLLVAVPLFYVFLTATVHRFNEVRQWSCRGMLGVVRASADTEAIVVRIRETFRNCQQYIHEQMVLVLVFAVIACSEPTWGYLTLAKLAILITLVTFAFVAATLVMSLLLAAVYDRRVNQALAFIANPDRRNPVVDYDRIRAELEAHSLIRMLMDRRTVAIVLGLVIVLTYTCVRWGIIYNK